MFVLSLGMHRQTNRSGLAGLPGTCQQSRLPWDGKATFTVPIGCERAQGEGWLGLGLGGSCTGPESPAIEAQCNEAARGAWSLAEARTEAEALQACRVGCLACAKCAYVSVSWRKRTCQWYSACDISRLVGGADGATFQTHFIRKLDRNSRAWSAEPVRQWRRHRMLLGATAVPPERSPRIWVINTSVRECNNSRHGKDLFEEKLPILFQSGFLRAASPADADFLYHPACLVDAFFRLRMRGSTRLRVLESVVMREVEAVRRATVKSTPVIVNSLRCYTRRPAVHEDIPFGYPNLWDGHQFLRFCGEALPTLDSEFSLYLPYCPATPWVVPPGLSPILDRPVSVLFQGGVETGRGRRYRAIGALKRTPGARLVVIDTPQRRGQSRQYAANWSADASFHADDERMAPMRAAVYTLCPAGHTPESQRIYQVDRYG